MLDGLKALIIVEKLGTVSEAAVHLRLTQSAVSKRIQALEIEIGYRVVERDGRKLRLTSAGLDLLARAKPLILEIDNLKISHAQAGRTTFSLGISDSIASSWGPKILRKCLETIPSLKLEIHAHRSTLIIENIKLGRYDLGLVTGETAGLASNYLGKESMVLVGNKSKEGGILTIEPASATWREIGPMVKSHPQLKLRALDHVESFSAAAQMAREGFGQGFVPEGIARALGFKQSEIRPLTPAIQRQIQFVARKTVFDLPLVQELIKNLRQFGKIYQ